MFILEAVDPLEADSLAPSGIALGFSNSRPLLLVTDVRFFGGSNEYSDLSLAYG